MKPFLFSLLEFQDTFRLVNQCLDERPGGSVECLTLAPHLMPPEGTLAQRTAAVGAVMSVLRDRGVLSRWYNELFPVGTAFREEPAFLLERGAYTLLGVKGTRVSF